MIIPISRSSARTACEVIAAAAKRSKGGSETSAKWRKIWTSKGTRHNLERLTLLDLLAIDGFDTGGGKMSEAMWFKLNQWARRKLKVRKGQTLLEVGCGAGAFLFPFARKGVAVSGIDYSPTMVEIARLVLPGATVQHMRRRTVCLSKTADSTRSSAWGCFLYFPSWRYTERVLEEMLRVLKPGGKCMIMDINDRAKRAEAEGKRKLLIGPRLYRKNVPGSGPHMYLRPAMVRSFLPSAAGCDASCSIRPSPTTKIPTGGLILPVSKSRPRRRHFQTYAQRPVDHRP